MAKIPAWQAGQARLAAKIARGSVGTFAAKSAAGAGSKAGLGSLLKGVAGKHPVMAAMGGYLLLQMILSRIMQHKGTAVEQAGQGQMLESQMQASPEDAYYQAMMPQLSQQRGQAQNALLQAILSGTGEVPQVPGERMIGGGM